MRKSRRLRGVWTTNKAFLFIIPGLFIFFLFNLYPIVYSIYLSFTNASFYNIAGGYHFIGLRNFERLLTRPDTKFYYVLGRTFLFVLTSVPLKVAFGLALAVIFNSQTVKGRSLQRSLLILPWTMPAMLSILVWKGMFSPKYGAINQILQTIGFAEVNWLLDANNAFIAYNIVEVWLAYPFMMTVTLAALQSIPPELYDSAKVDGAGTWQRLRYVTIPLISGPLSFATILTSSASFQSFLVPYLLNMGGPARLNELAMVYGYREAFQIGSYGYASAHMVTISIIIMVFMFIGMKASKMVGE